MLTHAIRRQENYERRCRPLDVNAPPPTTVRAAIFQVPMLFCVRISAVRCMTPAARQNRLHLNSAAFVAVPPRRGVIQRTQQSEIFSQMDEANTRRSCCHASIQRKSRPHTPERYVIYAKRENRRERSAAVIFAIGTRLVFSETRREGMEV